MTRATVCVVLAAGGVLAASAVASPMPKGKKQARVSHQAQQPGGTGSPDGPGWSDNFDAYANGSGLIGQGGWEGWAGTVPPPDAFASNAQSHSAPISCRLALGDLVTTSNSDLVHTYAVSGGTWVYRIQTYMPSTAVATTAPYFILLNTYPTFDWSVQIHFDKNLNRVLADRVGGAGGVGGGLADPPIPMIYDQWVELRVEIDLTNATANGSYDVTYGGTPVITDADWNTGAIAPFNLQAVDLYNDGIDFFFFDTASLAASGGGPVCYPNCDGSTTNPCLTVQDFGCFLNEYAAGNSTANCDGSTAIPILTVNDFGCFLNAYAAGCTAC